jgi:hypothetical protein
VGIGVGRLRYGQQAGMPHSHSVLPSPTARQAGAYSSAAVAGAAGSIDGGSCRAHGSAPPVRATPRPLAHGEAAAVAQLPCALAQPAGLALRTQAAGPTSLLPDHRTRRRPQARLTLSGWRAAAERNTCTFTFTEFTPPSKPLSPPRLYLCFTFPQPVALYLPSTSPAFLFLPKFYLLNCHPSIQCLN